MLCGLSRSPRTGASYQCPVHLRSFIILYHRGLENNADLADLRSRVEGFASSFAMPGFDVSSIKQSAPSANGVANGVAH
jgi:hypothetical protein